MPNFGEQFLHQKDSKLHTSQPVEHEQTRRKRKGEKTSQKPADKLVDFMEVLKQTHLGHRDDPRVLDRIKDSYHKKHVIDEKDIPQSYYDNQARLAREQGHGDIEIEEEQREQLSEVIRSDQESTMDKWLDYFMNPNSDSYPMWAKYWAFTNMTKLSSYDKEKHAFGKRDKGTVAPFPDLNREALAYVIDAVIKKVGKENIPQEDTNPEFQKLLQGANFGKLYAWAIEKVTPAEQNELLNTEGEWIKYNKGSDYMPLVESLQGHGTGWCIASDSTAEHYLGMGDHYIYYSYDQDGNPTIPRSTIRMEDNKIAEIRGIAYEQNLDPYIGDVVDTKMDKFPDGEQYKKKAADMKRLTEVDNRFQASQELTKDDLRFIYEMDGKIEGFGYDDDPRIAVMLLGRNSKADLSLVTGLSEEQISVTQEEAMSDGIMFHYGDLNLFLVKSVVDKQDPLKLPETIHGNLDLSDLTYVDGFELPKTITGDISLRKLKTIFDLKFPETLGGGIDLHSLTSIEGLELPDSVGGDLDLRGLSTAEGLELPSSIGGDLILVGLTSAEGLKFPDSVGGDIYLKKLHRAEGLELPSSIGGSLDLNNLTTAEGLKLPDSVGGDLGLGNLSTAEGLEFPDNMSGGLDLRSLNTVEGLNLPDSIGGDLDLSGLTSAEDLKLSDSIGGDLDLSSLTSTEGLKLPDSISGNLDLSRLTSAEGLEFPDSVGGYLDIKHLTSAKGLKLPDTIGSDLNLSGLTSVEGLKLPSNVKGSIHLIGIKSAEGLELPETVGGVIFLSNFSYEEAVKIKEKYPNHRFE